MALALQTQSLAERKIKVRTSFDSPIIITRAKNQIDIIKPPFIFTSESDNQSSSPDKSQLNGKSFQNPPEAEILCFCHLSRLSAEAREKKNFISWCQEAGIVEVLPYHQCDHLSRDQPDYLTCLVHLQVQNVSARYSVFITGETDVTSIVAFYTQTHSCL